MMIGDVTPWHRFDPAETREIIFHGWFCRAALDEAEARQRGGDRFALLALPAYCRPDAVITERFKNFFTKLNQQGRKPNDD